MARLRTPLGQNRLALARFDGQEALSEVFEFSVDAVSEEEDIDFNEAIGRSCTVEIDTYEGRTRYFNGILVEARWTGTRAGLYTYRLLLRPWLWLLSHRGDCRFFQNMTAPDIIRKVFSDAGFDDYRMRLSGSYPLLEYCVQYRESDFTFVSRLMEEHGIYYYFVHSDDTHMLMLADAMSAHEAIAPGTLAYIPLSGSYARNEEHLQQWNSERRFRSGRFVVNDYDFKKPNAKIEAEGEGNEPYERSKLEVYDYPGRYIDRSWGEQLAKFRLEAEQALDHRRVTAGEAPNVYAGGTLSVTGLQPESENVKYLAVRASHVVAEQSYRSSGGGRGVDTPYQGNYVLVPASRPYRAPMVTPKPVVHGIQTAKVVGDSGEEITVDEHGRIKVQFHWDRKATQSCWIRVAELWASKGWGGVFHPRHGQEVVVSFLEGDPDRPLVTGVVYNGENTPPYALPDNKTITGWKSNSSIGGGGYNEFVFDDKKGSEKIRMHAEKDHEVTIRHAETTKIGETFETPKGSPSRKTTIEKGDDQLDISTGDQNITIAQEQNLTIGLNRTTNVSVNDTTTVGMNRSTSIGMSDSLTAGMSVTVIAPMSITLSCGPTSLTLSPAGLTIVAPMVQVLGSANVTVLAPSILLQGAGAGMIPYPGMNVTLT
ncbi:type VI secretion system Vgr family protein [Ancylobacter crimeensis]|nr:type VI secretion system tip protein TssI/VgrG [Ancylobacter crimeensis]